ncbi:hypothetical protein RQP46_003064 [Phenoliferia psychrophenolica]
MHPRDHLPMFQPPKPGEWDDERGLFRDPRKDEDDLEGYPKNSRLRARELRQLEEERLEREWQAQQPHHHEPQYGPNLFYPHYGEEPQEGEKPHREEWQHLDSISSKNSLKSIKSWDRSPNVSTWSDSDFASHPSDDEDSDPPRPPPFFHAPLSAQANHPDSIADDNPVPKKLSVEERKKKVEERKAREKRKQDKLDAKRHVVDRTFVVSKKNWEIPKKEGEKKEQQPKLARKSWLGQGAKTWKANRAPSPPAAAVPLPVAAHAKSPTKPSIGAVPKPSNGAAGKVSNGATAKVSNGTVAPPPPVPVLGWKEQREADAKAEDAAFQADFLRKLDEKTRHREKKAREKRNKRIEERRYEAFMYEPLSQNHAYPDPYAAIDDLDVGDKAFEQYTAWRAHEEEMARLEELAAQQAEMRARAAELAAAERAARGYSPWSPYYAYEEEEEKDPFAPKFPPTRKSKNARPWFPGGAPDGLEDMI